MTKQPPDGVAVTARHSEAAGPRFANCVRVTAGPNASLSSFFVVCTGCEGLQDVTVQTGRARKVLETEA